MYVSEYVLFGPIYSKYFVPSVCAVSFTVKTHCVRQGFACSVLQCPLQKRVHGACLGLARLPFARKITSQQGESSFPFQAQAPQRHR